MPEMELHPYHPIIFVRGFAATSGDIENAVADPYMGFNERSTKSRKLWTGDVQKFFFESPLVRLMSEHGYEDTFDAGEDILQSSRTDVAIPYRSIVVYRYYDEASKDFGTGDTPPIEHFAKGLSDLVLRLRDRICDAPGAVVKRDQFRVHLVAHSMGGLICRAFLQNPNLGADEARAAVEKLFTYATPHNGIDMRIVRNVPGWLSFGDANNFNRDRMSDYLAVPKSEDVSVVTGFPPERIFNLVGTNPRDYAVAKGLSAWAAGDESDGLVRIENATTHGLNYAGRDVESPRAFVHRSHSGSYGIVNSEEGYQNLTRFLFGAIRFDGFLDIDDISLPPELQKAHEEGKSIKASYQFEVAVSVRACQWQMTRRSVRENSAIFRTYDELFPGAPRTNRPPDRTRSPQLFSVYLDPQKSVMRSNSVSFSFELRVLVPDYTIGDVPFLKRHYEGSSILQETIVVEAVPDSSALGGWKIRYGLHDTPGKAGRAVETLAVSDDRGEALGFSIPLQQRSRPGFNGALRFEAREVGAPRNVNVQP